MLSTLLDQLASAQPASAQLASFQLASAQLASLQLACAHDAPDAMYDAQLAALNERPPAVSGATNWYRPTFGFGGVSKGVATPPLISPTPPALSSANGREVAQGINAALTLSRGELG